MKWEFLYNSCCCSLCTQLKFMFHFYKKWCSSYTSAEKFKLFDFLFSDAHTHKLTHTHTHLKRKYDVEKFVFDMVTHTVFFFWYSSLQVESHNKFGKISKSGEIFFTYLANSFSLYTHCLCPSFFLPFLWFFRNSLFPCLFILCIINRSIESDNLVSNELRWIKFPFVQKIQRVQLKQDIPHIYI